jgi:uncharacterized lipoprotein YbaY/heat shock protein HslJ
VDRTLAPALLALAATLTQPAMGDEVRGTATYTERIALPDNVVFEAVVQDVSRADAAAVTVGRTRIENPGAPPIAFTIAVPAEKIDPRGRYSVRATLSGNGRLLMTTDRHTPVLTQGAGGPVELQLRPVASAREARAAPSAATLGALPATFTGDLPCADCPALRYTLNLFADGAFYLREFYEGRNAPPRYDIGRWMLSSDGVIVQLAGGRDAPVRLRIVDADTLRLLAPDGTERPPAPRPWLVRREEFQPISPELAMSGMVRVDGDSVSFTECLTGQRWPVDAEGDAAKLRAAVSAPQGAAARPVLVSLEGALSPAGAGAAPTLRVMRVISAWPGRSCRDRGGTSSLTNMYWKLTLLKGQPVFAAARQREPSLILAQADGRSVARGSGGCHNFSGPFELAGNALTLAPRVLDGPECAAGMAQQRAYLAALSEVRSWRIIGQQLELFDGAGGLLARYEARALR